MKIKNLLLIPIMIGCLAACSTLRENEPTAKLFVQYATIKYLEGLPPGKVQESKLRIVRIANDLKALAEQESVTLTLLQTAVDKELDKANLSESDRFLADALVTVVALELQKKINVGLLSPSERLQVRDFLDWVIAAVGPLLARTP